MPTLRSQIIRLAASNPEVRPHLLPLLKQAMEFDTPEALQKYLKDHPGADKSNHSVKKPGGRPKKEKPPSKKEVGEANRRTEVRGKARDAVGEINSDPDFRKGVKQLQRRNLGEEKYAEVVSDLVQQVVDKMDGYDDLSDDEKSDVEDELHEMIPSMV